MNSLNHLLTLITLTTIQWSGIICDAEADRGDIKGDAGIDGKKDQNELPIDDALVDVVEEIEFDLLGDYLAVNKHVFVKFYAPWCTHCRQMAEDYEKAAKQLKQFPNVKLIKINATTNRPLQEKYDVQGYPTLKFFRNSAMEDYNGQRSAETIVAWVTAAVGSPVNTIDEPKKIPKTEKTAFLLADYKDDQYLDLFTKTADQHRKYGLFYAINDPKKEANLVVIQDENTDVKCSGATAEELHDFIVMESVPVYGQINVETEPLYSGHPLPKLFFAATVEDHKKTYDTLLSIGKELRKHYVTLWVNIDQFKMYATEELKIKEFPGFTIMNMNGRFVLPEPEAGLKDPRKIVQYALDVKDGKITRVLESDVEPDHVPGKARIIVATTWEKYVNQNTNDVFLLIYANWCGHCKSMEADYDEFSRKVESSGLALNVLKIDGSKNEIPNPSIQIRGFPTLLLIRSGSQEIITYAGGRTTSALMEFAEKNCSKKQTAEEEL